jgi:hypothetical protein
MPYPPKPTPKPTYYRLAKEHAETAAFLHEIAAKADGGLAGRLRIRILRRADHLAHLAEQALADDEGAK